MEAKRIILSRTDSIGDVVLTLPMAGMIRKLLPGAEIIFLGRKYTRDVVNSSVHIDRFIDWDELDPGADHETPEQFRQFPADIIIHVFPVRVIAWLAQRAAIPVRIGTTGRPYHFFTCNRLVPFSRKRSRLHEAQLNMKLLKPLGLDRIPDIDEIPFLYGLADIPALPGSLKKLVSREKFNLILHPRSKGSAREWGLKNFRELVKILPEDEFEIFITGTGEEKTSLSRDGFFDGLPATDLTGSMTLAGLIAFINACDGLVAASTGPLHLSAALGKHTIGLFPPIRPMHPGRWAPLGRHAEYLVLDKECSDCRHSTECACIRDISPAMVAERLIKKATSGK